MKAGTSYGSNVQYLPLQAADVIAHEIMRIARNRPNTRGINLNDDPDAWIINRLRKQRGALWFVELLAKTPLEMELNGKAWVPHGWPSYRFLGPSEDAV
jgi:hypothetical protein